MNEQIYAKPYNLGQQLLVPIDINEVLPENHLSRFIADVTLTLDLSMLTKPSDEHIGQRPYDPRMMFNLLFYAYSVGVRSSRKIEEKIHLDLAFRYLAAGHNPDHVTISRFREENLDILTPLFVQVLMICKKGGLVKLGKIAIDGTKIKANASLRKTKDYNAIKKEYDVLEKEVKKLFREAQKNDEKEDARYGKDRRGDELPEKLRNTQDRLKELEKIKKEMETEAKRISEKKAEEIANREQEEKESGKKKRGRKPKPLSDIPGKKARHNFTDPDSRIMKDNGTKALVQGYNCQNIVNTDSQIVISCDVTQDANDKHQTIPMIDMLVEIIEQLGMKPEEVIPQLQLLLDAGYFTENDLKKLIGKGWDIYTTPDNSRSKGKDIQMKGRIPKSMSFPDRMRRKTKTKRGKKIYKKRKIVEAPFGHIKEARGIRRFLLRGLRKVKGEWTLINLTHNLLVMHRNGVKI